VNDRVIFMGSPAFAVPSLSRVLKEFRVVGVVTQKDRPKGRGRGLASTPVKREAQEFGISVLEFDKISSPEAIECLALMQPDFIVVAAFGQILTPAVLALPQFGCVNLHASLLPRHRGPSPISEAILSGDTVTGVTTMLMDEGIDTGDILLAKTIVIESHDTAGSLHDKLASEGALLLTGTLKGILDGTIGPRPQDNSAATCTKLLRKSDGRIDWNREAIYLSRLVRAMNPWPSAYCLYGTEALKVLTARLGTGQGSPGRIERIDGDAVVVGTGQGTLDLLSVQPAGKSSMSAVEFLRGRRLAPGFQFS
jgi:methionyl-tRNA formyltransferase